MLFFSLRKTTEKKHLTVLGTVSDCYLQNEVVALHSAFKPLCKGLRLEER